MSLSLSLSLHVSLSSFVPDPFNFSPPLLQTNKVRCRRRNSSMLHTTAFLALGATVASPVSREASADFEAVASKLAGTSRRGYIDGVRLDPGARFA